jgi:hypothetical protein
MMTARRRHITNQAGSRGKVFQSPSAIRLFIEPQRVASVVDIEAQDNRVALIVEVLNVYTISFRQHSVLKSREVFCQSFSLRSSG